MKVPTSTDAWDRFWQGTSDEAAYCSEGISDAATRGFWQEVFHSVSERSDSLTVADFCSGNGAVLRAAVNVFGRDSAEFCCIDRSSAAIRALQRQFPGVRGIVSDAHATPLADGEFMLVTSQFGIEYAGLDAVNEMLRVLRGGGSIALLIHHAGSPISAKCRANAEALAQLEDLHYLSLTRRMFEAAFACSRAAKEQKASRDSSRALDAFGIAHSAVEELLNKCGGDACGGTLLRLHGDISRMHARIRFQDPPAVLRWLDYMQAELSAFGERMQSQLQAGITPERFFAFCGKLAGAGMQVQRHDVLTMDAQESPLAWALIAVKPH